MTRRFAEDTRVTVASSRGEITGILTAHGCDRMAWGTAPEGDTLQFTLGGRLFRFTIGKPTWEEIRGRFVNQKDLAGRELAVDAEWRRRWRAHVLLIKAKLEFIEGGDTTLEREFLPYAVLKNGQTVAELVAAGGLPMLAAGAAR